MFAITIACKLAAVAIVWAVCSFIIWIGIKGLKDGNIFEQIQYSRMSTTMRRTLVFFAPVLLLKKLIGFILSLWQYIIIVALIVWACTFLSGCQVNVVTAPHATFMVDSVTAESIDQGIYERNAE